MEATTINDNILVRIVFLFTFLSMALGHEVGNSGQFPLVVSTWPFLEAVRAAWRAVESGFSVVDAVVEGCSACEVLRCDGTVGPGGSPDENGETTIDALVMNGATMEVGAVAAMRYVKDGAKAVRLVMQHSEHTMLVGEQAAAFAISMGLSGPINLSSTESLEKWIKWKENSCQPNFRKNVLPIDWCGPYHPKETAVLSRNKCLMANVVETTTWRSSHVGCGNHDTISMAVVDKMGHIVVVGTSTNGATFKIPGRPKLESNKSDDAQPAKSSFLGTYSSAMKYPEDSEWDEFGNEYAAMNSNFVGYAEGALGICDWLESQGHQYIVTNDNEGPNYGIRDHIMSKSVCVCGATNILADDLLPNKTLRKTINRMLESNNNNVENSISAFQVQDMESKIWSPTHSIASKGEQVPPPQSKDISKVKETGDQGRFGPLHIL